MAFKEKLLSSQPPVEAGGRHYKRYYVTSAAAVITPEVEKAALALLPDLVRHMLLPAAADLAGYLSDTMAAGTTGRPR